MTQDAHNMWLSSSTSIGDSDSLSGCQITQVAFEVFTHAEDKESMQLSVHGTSVEVCFGERTTSENGKGSRVREGERS